MNINKIIMGSTLKEGIEKNLIKIKT